MRPLEDRHALITGASRGIGAAIARALGEAGAALSLLGRDQKALLQRARELGGRAHVEVCDVTDPEAVHRAVRGAEAAWGPVHILVNNAGQAESCPFPKTEPELWERMLRVNLTGAFLCTRAVLPGMLQAGWGRIVNVASTAGLKGYPYVAAYVAAKHGLVGLTRALALELAQKNITVNAVCPGFTETGLLEDSIARIVEKTGRSPGEAREELVRANPQGRFVRPEEVAQAVLWLALPGSAAVNGQAIAVAGGEV